MTQNLGERSVKSVVKLRGGPCKLKRHFRGCLRQVIGFLDLMASLDPGGERFVWAKLEGIQKRTKRWDEFSRGRLGEPGEGQFGRSQIYLCLKFARQLGIITPAKRYRVGCWRRGYIVVSHDAIAIQSARSCALIELPQHEVTSVKLGSSEAQAELSEAQSDEAILIGQNQTPNRTKTTPNRTSNRTEWAS